MKKHHLGWFLVAASCCLLPACRGEVVQVTEDANASAPKADASQHDPAPAEPGADLSLAETTADLPPVEPAADDWPWWRGPTLDNKAAPGQDPPVHWSETDNVIWKAEVPGRGHGSPCIWGQRIFLATADEKAQTQSLLCYDRQSGSPLWQKELHRGGFVVIHKKNSHASSTPACDGQRVFIPFVIQDALWLTALDLDGNIVWQKRLEPFESEHGYGASPLIYKSLVIVVGDHSGGGILVALNRKSGNIVWQVPRAKYRDFASPIVGHVCGRDQLLIMGPNETNSYDPNTGENLWRCDGPTEVAAGTMPFGEKLVYASAGWPKRNLLCIRADGTGDVTDTHIVWRAKEAAYVPSLLLDDGLLYVANDSGLFRCFEAENGKVVWKQKLDGGFSSSPVLAGGHIYVVNEAGVMYVVKPGRQYELVAQNDLHDGGFATPVICASRIYLRTSHNLYCLGKPSGS